jgi:DNA-binding CsgD family transcriptional regulator
MATSRTVQHALADLRAFGSARLRRQPRVPDAGPQLQRLLAPCKTLAVEERASGIAFRLQGTTEGGAVFSITCILHHARVPRDLTTAEQAVAEQLCEGRTLAQIARLRGVSVNTVKSQVRQIFRKLNVDSRVALVRRLCP